MKEITVKVSDNCFAEIRTNLIFKQMTGNLYGILDEFCARFVKAIEDGETLMELELKADKDPAAKKPRRKKGK